MCQQPCAQLATQGLRTSAATEGSRGPAKGTRRKRSRRDTRHSLGRAAHASRPPGRGRRPTGFRPLALSYLHAVQGRDQGRGHVGGRERVIAILRGGGARRDGRHSSGRGQGGGGGGGTDNIGGPDDGDPGEGTTGAMGSGGSERGRGGRCGGAGGGGGKCRRGGCGTRAQFPPRGDQGSDRRGAGTAKRGAWGAANLAPNHAPKPRARNMRPTMPITCALSRALPRTRGLRADLSAKRRAPPLATRASVHAPLCTGGAHPGGAECGAQRD